MTFNITPITNSLGGYGGWILGAGVLLVILAVAKVFRAKKQRNLFMLLGISAILIPVIVGLSAGGVSLFAAGITGGVIQAGENIQTNLGDSATVYLKAYDAEATSQTQVYPAYTVYDKDSAILIDGVYASSAATTVGNVLAIYGADNASYYLDSKTGYNVNSAAPSLNLVAHTVAKATSMNVSAYNDVMTALTDAAGAQNTDYNVTFGASEAKIQYIKITNAQSNSLYRLGAICSYRTNATSINKVEIVEAGWVRTHIPKAVKDVSSTMTAGDAGTPAISYYDCWAPSSPISLKQYDSVTIKTRTEAGSNQPQTATSSAYGFIILDTGSSKGKDGTVSSDYYVHDDNENVNTVGAAEVVTTPYTGGYAVGITAS